MDVAILQRHEMFFGPYPIDFGIRMGEDVMRLLLAIMLPVEEMRPFKNCNPDEIAPAEVEFVCKIMQLDPKKRPSAKDLLQDRWFSDLGGS